MGHSKRLGSHPWAENPRYGDESLRIPSPKLLPKFQELVRWARRFQHGSLTARQYDGLQAAFMKARYPIGSPMFGWYYTNRLMLLKALVDEGVFIRREPSQRLHPFRLTQSGTKRLSEIERKIHARRK
jgi:hypothetical protein